MLLLLQQATICAKAAILPRIALWAGCMANLKEKASWNADEEVIDEMVRLRAGQTRVERSVRIRFRYSRMGSPPPWLQLLM